MPQVTVYIREEDLEKWKAVEKKSEFIHNALNPLNSVQGITKRVKDIVDRPEQEFDEYRNTVYAPPEDAA